MSEDCSSRLDGYLADLMDFMMARFQDESRTMRLATRIDHLSGRIAAHSEAHADLSARLSNVIHGGLGPQRAAQELLELLDFWRNRHVPEFDAPLECSLNGKPPTD